MRDKKIQKLATILSTVTISLAILLLVYYSLQGNVERINKEKEEQAIVLCEYETETEQSAEAPAGVIKHYNVKIDHVGNRDYYLFFYTIHQYVEVSVDGEVQYSLKPVQGHRIGRTVGSNWTKVPLDKADEGTEIQVTLTPAYSIFTNQKMEFLCGEENQIFKHLINKDIFEVVLSIIAVIGGMIFVILSLYNWRKKTPTEEILMVGTFSIIMGFSRLSDIRLMQFLWNKRPTFNFYLSVLTLVIGMYPILVLMKKRLNQISKLILNIGTVIVSVVAGGVILLQIFNIRDFRECLWVIHVLIGFVVALILGCYIYDMCCKKKEQRKFDIVRMPYICVIGALVDVIVFYIRGTSSSLIFSLMSFLIYIFMRGIQLVIEHMNYRARMQEQEVKLAEERMFIMLSQIQPHFIFNVLGSIYHLCDQNPTLAKEAIDQFSTYLRGNLEALSKKNLVSFEEEFRHVSIYLALEKMRFADELDIKYDIQAKDFFVPALSIQPLVENAVKHGIGAKIEGGSVTIATLDLVEYYEIRIFDDGIGFDPEKPMNDGRTHVGISNVRSRLESMCKGTLEIQSEPGKGTVSIIRIPKESEETVS